TVQAAPQRGVPGAGEGHQPRPRAVNARVRKGGLESGRHAHAHGPRAALHTAGLADRSAPPGPGKRVRAGEAQSPDDARARLADPPALRWCQAEEVGAVRTAGLTLGPASGSLQVGLVSCLLRYPGPEAQMKRWRASAFAAAVVGWCALTASSQPPGGQGGP